MLAPHSEGPSPFQPQKMLVDVGSSLKGEEGAGTTAFNCSASTDDRLRYATSFMFDHLHWLILNGIFYPKVEALCDMLQYVQDCSYFPEQLQICPNLCL